MAGGGGGGGGDQRPPGMENPGGQGCKSKSLLCEGYGYFPEPLSSNYFIASS